jgi:NTE family protein
LCGSCNLLLLTAIREGNVVHQSAVDIDVALGANRAHLSPQIGNSSVLPTVSGTTGETRWQYTFQTVDDPVIPRSGENIVFYTKYFNTNPAAPHGFPLSELQIQNFFRISDPSSVFLNAYGASSYGFKTGVPAFPLGGVTRFLAYGQNELLTDQYFLGQLGYIRELKKLPPLLGSSIDFLAMFEVGKRINCQMILNLLTFREMWRELSL